MTNTMTYKGPRIDKATANSTYELKDSKLGVLYTGSFRQCWIRREILAKYESIDRFIIEIVYE